MKAGLTPAFLFHFCATMKVRYPILFVLFITVIYSCKTTKPTQTTYALPNIDTAVVVKAVPPPVFITSTGDTLHSLDEEVAIGLTPVKPESVTLMAVGDLMTGTNFPNPSFLPMNNGDLLWKEVAPILKQADITFGNLEGVILDEGGEQKECKNPKACYLFRTPTYLAYQYKAAGFDLLSLANNHANDFGQTGRTHTQKTLDSLGIQYAGAVETPSSMISSKRLKIALIAVAPNKGTISIHQTEKLIKTVQSLDTLHDIVMVSFHAGAEGKKNMHVTRKREFYYGEDRGNVYEFSHQMIDAGADVLIGHGPHVPRAIEVYKNRFIAYSLGNFLTYGRFNLRGPSGEAPLVELELAADGSFKGGQIHAFYQDYTLGPRSDDRKRAIKTIANLSKEDFPENPIEIDESGRIFYIQN